MAFTVKQSGKSSLVLGDEYLYHDKNKSSKPEIKSSEYSFDQSSHHSKTYKSSLFRNVPLSTEPLPTEKPARRKSLKSVDSKFNIFLSSDKVN